MAAENGKTSARHRLTSWKEIAAFVGRDERTVKRWEESRGLPVRRVPGTGRASVFAYGDEIEAWMRGDSSAAQGLLRPTASPEMERRKRPGLGLLSVAALLVAVAAAYLLQRENAPLAPRYIPDPVAQEYYRSGLHAWQTRTPSGLARAVSDFNSAVARDPRYAAAYAGLADAYNLEAEFTAVPAVQAYPKAAAAAERAITLDSTLASAHAALAFAEFYWSRDIAAAKREFVRALALDPANADTHHWYATFLMTVGESGSALTEIGKAEALDSESTAIPADKALILFHAGKTADAVRLLTQLESDQPAFASPHRYLATIWRSEGSDGAYLRELKLLALARHDARDLSLADAGARGLAKSGHDGMLRAMLAVRHTLYASGKEPAYEVAANCAELGDADCAIAYLAISIARHEPENVALKIDPWFASLRRDSRFPALLVRAGFVQQARTPPACVRQCAH